MTLSRATKPRQTRFKSRYVLPSDRHHFVGRIYELSIVGMHFDSYEEAHQYSDVRYALEVNESTSALAERIESLNLVGDMLWLPRGTDYRLLPISAHSWLTVSTDAFLMRYISVVDCAMILVSDIWETGLKPSRVTLRSLKRLGVPKDVLGALETTQALQGSLRIERNERFHHGTERSFTDDDTTLRMVSLFHHRGSPMRGSDRYGRKINIDIAFREALSKLQSDFNRHCKALIASLDELYDLLSVEFERRFIPRIRAAKHGLNSRPMS
jgi:hypothetical protein